ncbi:MAG: DegT/DnrJ/EryC1/StrS family aminotransferase [Patescibacteria group bacterium]|nr:DegT/DnrJ/EryC1/StrS family aminotransferase [Patescibacteria group bacterium]
MDIKNPLSHTFYDLYPLHKSIKRELEEKFSAIIDRSQFILGQELENFEQEFADFIGVKYCIGVNSGLDALIISLKALGIEHGDEVIVPGFTFFATWLAVVNVGAIPVPIDVRPEDANIDPQKIVERISPKTKAIIAVHLYGNPADMPAILEIARRFSLFVVEDNAQAVGASILGQKTGSFGHINATSFYPTKNLGALGDGGAITTNDALLAEKCRKMRNYGSISKYKHEMLGFNSRLDELQAAFLRIKLKYLETHVTERRKLAAQLISVYNERLQNQLTFVRYSSEAAPHILSCLDTKGILSSYELPSHYPYCINDFHELLGIAKSYLPVAEKFARFQVSLPFYLGIISEA